ncbi:MAG: hypothetical protein ACI8TL_000312, partial [Natronomonas sp.]
SSTAGYLRSFVVILNVNRSQEPPRPGDRRTETGSLGDDCVGVP